MVKVKSSSTIKQNYRQGAQVAGPRYKEGVASSKPWKEAALASEDLYAQKMQESLAARRRERAISNLNESDWKDPAMAKGARNIGPAMTDAVDKQARNFEPFRQALESVQLPARTADPLTNVQQRVLPIVEALVNKKKELKG